VGTHFIAYIPYNTATESEFCYSCSPFLTQLNAQSQSFYANGSPSEPLPISLNDEVNELPTVADASPCLSLRIDDPGMGVVTMVGVDFANTLAVPSTCVGASYVIEGQYIKSADTGLVLLEESFARTRQLSPGSQITINNIDFNVAGVVNPPNRPVKADIFMTLNDADNVINTNLTIPARGIMNIVLVESASAKIHKQAIDDVKTLLGQNSLVSTYGCWSPASRAMGIDEKGLWLAAIIAAVAVVALTLKSQYSSVIERRRDIGILKTIGWSNGSVVSQILAESVIQAVIGGLLGCMVALIILLLIPAEVLTGIKTSGIPVYPMILGAGFGLALLGGIIAGIFPALAAARLRPGDSLRRI
jgi:putative ABC transport system permease protein